MLYPILYLEINLASVMLVLYIRFKTLGISQMVSQRNFSSAIDAEVVFFLSDTVAVLISCGLIPAGKAGLLAAKSTYFFSTALMCFFWFIYFEHMQGSQFVANRRLVLLSSCLVWIMGILLIVNLFNGMLFYVDDGGVYHRGPLFVLQYLLSYTYVFAACGHALVGCFQEKRLSQRHLLISLALFPVVPAIAGILQFIYPELPVACIVLAGATMILYQNWLDELISVDPLTRLNNRKQLVYHFDQWQRREDPVPLYLLLIDANKFKQINDMSLDTAARKGTRFCDALAMIERELENVTPEERLKVRLEKSLPIVEEFFAWVRNLNPGNDQLKKTKKYALNQEECLRRFLEDGRIPISNNPAENAIRPFVIGRKNFLFCVSEAGAQATANAYSLAETAKANGLDVPKYFEHVLHQMRMQDGHFTKEFLDTLLPWNDVVQKACKRVQI